MTIEKGMPNEVYGSNEKPINRQEVESEHKTYSPVMKNSENYSKEATEKSRESETGINFTEDVLKKLKEKNENIKDELENNPDDEYLNKRLEETEKIIAETEDDLISKRQKIYWDNPVDFSSENYSKEATEKSRESENKETVVPEDNSRETYAQELQRVGFRGTIAGRDGKLVASSTGNKEQFRTSKIDRNERIIEKLNERILSLEKQLAEEEDEKKKEIINNEIILAKNKLEIYKNKLEEEPAKEIFRETGKGSIKKITGEVEATTDVTNEKIEEEVTEDSFKNIPNERDLENYLNRKKDVEDKKPEETKKIPETEPETEPEKEKKPQTTREIVEELKLLEDLEMFEEILRNREEELVEIEKYIDEKRNNGEEITEEEEMKRKKAIAEVQKADINITMTKGVALSLEKSETKKDEGKILEDKIRMQNLLLKQYEVLGRMTKTENEKVGKLNSGKQEAVDAYSNTAVNWVLNKLPKSLTHKDISNNQQAGTPKKKWKGILDYVSKKISGNKTEEAEETEAGEGGEEDGVKFKKALGAEFLVLLGVTVGDKEKQVRALKEINDLEGENKKAQFPEEKWKEIAEKLLDEYGEGKSIEEFTEIVGDFRIGEKDFKEAIDIMNGNGETKEREIYGKISNATRLKDLAEVVVLTTEKYAIKPEGIMDSLEKKLKDENYEEIQSHLKDWTKEVMFYDAKPEKNVLLNLYDKIGWLLKEKEGEVETNDEQGDSEEGENGGENMDEMRDKIEIKINMLDDNGFKEFGEVFKINKDNIINRNYSFSAKEFRAIFEKLGIEHDEVRNFGTKWFIETIKKVIDNQSQNIKSENEKDFVVGKKVFVKRTNGDIEDNWTIVKIEGDLIEVRQKENRRLKKIKKDKLIEMQREAGKDKNKVEEKIKELGKTTKEGIILTALNTLDKTTLEKVKNKIKKGGVLANGIKISSLKEKDPQVYEEYIEKMKKNLSAEEIKTLENANIGDIKQGIKFMEEL